MSDVLMIVIGCLIFVTFATLALSLCYAAKLGDEKGEESKNDN